MPLYQSLPILRRNFSSLAIRPCRYALFSVSIRGQSTVHTSEITGQEVKSFDEMPGGKPLPFIGTTWPLLKESRKKPFTKAVLDFQFRGVQKYGKIHKNIIPGFSTPVVNLADPDEVHKLYQQEPKYPKRFDLQVLNNFLEERKKTKGVFSANGIEWYRHRSVISKKVLRPKEVAAYSPMLNDVVTDLMIRFEKIKEQPGSEFAHEVKTLESELFKWSFESVSYVLLERRMGCLSEEISQDSRELIKAVQGFFEALFPVTLTPPWLHKYYKTKPYKLFIQSMENMYKYAEKFIDMRLMELHKDDDNIGNRKDAQDENVGFFQFLVANGKLSREDIVGSVIDLLFAGVETTSHSMLWVLYMLGKNQEKQEMLHQEITSVLPPGEIPTVDHINNMHYLKAWIKETLRLYPIIPSNARILQEDMIIGGYHIPQGTHVAVPIFLMGRDKGNFKEPTKFLPERWLRDHDMNTFGLPHAFATLPFGFGKRMCVGRRIAELEMYLLLARIVQKYNVLYPHSDEVEPEAKGTLCPDRDVRVKFIKRDTA